MFQIGAMKTDQGMTTEAFVEASWVLTSLVTTILENSWT